MEIQYKHRLQKDTYYDFIDISNNNGQMGQVHYETGLWVRNHIAKKGIVRPINNVKIYGGPRDQPDR